MFCFCCYNFFATCVYEEPDQREIFFEPVNKIKRFLYERHQILRQMDGSIIDTKPLKNYSIPTNEESHSSIIHPPIMANNFKIKPLLVRMVQQNQFSGLPTGNPNLHLSNFIEFCGTLKANGVDQNAIQIRLLPFSLRDRARVWIQYLSTNSITTWAQIKAAFLAQFFLPSKTT